MAEGNGKPNGKPAEGNGFSASAPARADATVPGIKPEKGKAGRPTKLTPEAIEGIVTHLKGGNYFETACGANGISPAIGRQWLREGANDRSRGRKTMKARFHEAVEKAQHQGESALVLQLRVHAQKDFRAAAFMLERKFPKRWGKTVEQIAPDATPASPLAGRSDADLTFFIEHGHWPEEAP